MITPFLFALLGLQQPASAQAVEMTFQRVAELQGQVNDLRTRVTELRGQVGELARTNEQIRTEIQKVSNCEADVQWLPLSSSRAVDPQLPIAISLFSVVSQPSESCLGAEVRITANYYDAKGAFVCSGSLGVPQMVNVQNHLFEFRPTALEYFMKWRDGQTWDRSNYHLLKCFDYDGIENRDPAPMAASVKLFATVLPRRGGVARSEITFTLPVPTQAPPPRPSVPRIFE
jgi:hypothetical protein